MVFSFFLKILSIFLLILLMFARETITVFFFIIALYFVKNYLCFQDVGENFFPSCKIFYPIIIELYPPGNKIEIFYYMFQNLDGLFVCIFHNDAFFELRKSRSLYFYALKKPVSCSKNNMQGIRIIVELFDVRKKMFPRIEKGNKPFVCTICILRRFRICILFLNIGICLISSEFTELWIDFESSHIWEKCSIIINKSKYLFFVFRHFFKCLYHAKWKMKIFVFFWVVG